MPITQVTTAIKGIIHISFGKKGWADSHWMVATTKTQAAEDLKKIAWARTVWFGEGVEIEWARVSEEVRPIAGPGGRTNVRDAYAVDLPYPLGPHHALGSTIEPPNDPYVGIRFRLECDSGAWANRTLRGIGDVYIRNFRENVATPVTLTPFAVGSPSILANPWASSNIGAISRSYLSYLRDLTLRCHSDPAPTTVYDVEPWNRILCRGVGKRDTGGPFGQSRGRARRRS